MPSVAPWGLGLWVIHVKLSETVTHQRCRIGLVLDLLDDSQVLDFAFSDFLEFLWHILKSISRVPTISCQGADESWWVLLGFDRDLRILRFLENHGKPRKVSICINTLTSSRCSSMGCLVVFDWAPRNSDHTAHQPASCEGKMRNKCNKWQIVGVASKPCYLLWCLRSSPSLLLPYFTKSFRRDLEKEAETQQGKLAELRGASHCKDGCYRWWWSFVNPQSQACSLRLHFLLISSMLCI